MFEGESNTAKIIAIADGVSSCINCKRGAEIACQAVSEIMLEETEYIFSANKDKIAGLLSAYIYRKLLFEAKQNKQTVDSYASTLSFVCYNKITNEIMTFVLGDSLIYLIDKGNITLVTLPDLPGGSTTYATTTKDVVDVINIKIFKAQDDSRFLLATDGAWETFYLNGVLSEKLQQAAKENTIIEYLEKQICYDDCSIAIMDIPKGA